MKREVLLCEVSQLRARSNIPFNLISVFPNRCRYEVGRLRRALNSKKHQDLVADYKMLVGNVFNFETVFRDDNSNDEMTVEFQTKYRDVIGRYREIYEVNFDKWREGILRLL